jgi:hypothetical protein
MKYLDIENGKCAGWVIPMYHCTAIEFAKEVTDVCKVAHAGKNVMTTRNGKIPTEYTVYEYQDGTEFVITYAENGELALIEARDTCSNGFDTVYYNSGINEKE